MIRNRLGLPARFLMVAAAAAWWVLVRSGRRRGFTAQNTATWGADENERDGDRRRAFGLV